VTTAGAHGWIREVAASLSGFAEARAASIETAYGEIVAGRPDGWTRRGFAERTVRHPTGGFFLLPDGKNYRRLLRRQPRPSAELDATHVE
jgi:RNA ligase